jgi:hypothetical protein
MSNIKNTIIKNLYEESFQKIINPLIHKLNNINDRIEAIKNLTPRKISGDSMYYQIDKTNSSKIFNKIQNISFIFFPYNSNIILCFMIEKTNSEIDIIDFDYDKLYKYFEDLDFEQIKEIDCKDISQEKINEYFKEYIKDTQKTSKYQMNQIKRYMEDKGIVIAYSKYKSTIKISEKYIFPQNIDSFCNTYIKNHIKRYTLERLINDKNFFDKIKNNENKILYNGSEKTKDELSNILDKYGNIEIIFLNIINQIKYIINLIQVDKLAIKLNDGLCFAYDTKNLYPANEKSTDIIKFFFDFKDGKSYIKFLKEEKINLTYENLENVINQVCDKIYHDIFAEDNLSKFVNFSGSREAGKLEFVMLNGSKLVYDFTFKCFDKNSDECEKLKKELDLIQKTFNEKFIITPVSNINILSLTESDQKNLKQTYPYNN